MIDLFFDNSRDVAMATDFVQKLGKIAYPLQLSLWHSETVWDIAISHTVNKRVNSGNDACILCENFVKFGPVTPQLTGLI